MIPLSCRFCLFREVHGPFKSSLRAGTVSSPLAAQDGFQTFLCISSQKSLLVVTFEHVYDHAVTLSSLVNTDTQILSSLSKPLVIFFTGKNFCLKDPPLLVMPLRRVNLLLLSQYTYLVYSILILVTGFATVVFFSFSNNRTVVFYVHCVVEIDLLWKLITATS